MLFVKRCNVKHNFVSAVTMTRVQIVIEKIIMLFVVIQTFKKSVMSPLYTFRKSLFDIPRLKSPCIAHQPDGIHPVQIHLMGFGIYLIIAVSVVKRLSLYEFTLWGRHLVPVDRRIRESPY